MKTENKEPLYKVLDKQRTKGEWNMYISEKGKDGCSRAYINSALPHDMYETICTMSGLNGKEAGEAAKANAEYTALAVNNLASLAEALEDIIAYHSDIESRPGHKLGGTIPFLKAKKALSKIS